MNVRTKIEIGVAVILAVTLCFTIAQNYRIRKMAEERERYRNNTEALLTEVDKYKTRDSLNAAQILTLQLSVKEYERFRAEDAALIRTLKANNRDLAAVNKTQAQTIIELSAIPRDTVIISNTDTVKAIAVHCGDQWYDFDGVLTDDNFSGRLVNRDSLMVVETVKYKRCFFFKTKKIKDRKVDVVSRNPHTEIMNVEHIIVGK